MDDRKTIFDYLGQVFIIFGITIMILNLFCILFGESAKEYSEIFKLGKEGIGIDTMMQFFLISVCTVAINSLLFTDIIIKNMRLVLRMICMITLEILIIIVFVLTCGWFPIDMWQPWVMFLLCFGICFVVSCGVTTLKERMENKKMEEALKRIKGSRPEELNLSDCQRRQREEK